MLLYMNKSKSMISNKSISNSIINNDMILPLLGVAITLYSVMIVPKINLKNFEILDNMLFKLFLVIIVYYLSTKNKTYGIILSIGILFTVLGLKMNNNILLTQQPSNNIVLSQQPSNNIVLSQQPSNNIVLSQQPNDNIVLSPLRSDLVKNAINTKNELTNLLNTTNDNNTINNIKSNIIIQDHIIDSALEEKSHLHSMTLSPTSGANIEYHEKSAYLNKIKLNSLLNTVELRKILDQAYKNNDDNLINEILLLLTHENNKIDLVSNIKNELNNGLDAIKKNDNTLAKEHFDNINNYEIELSEKLRLDNLEHIKKYYNDCNNEKCSRPSNEYNTIEPSDDYNDISPYDPLSN